MGGAGYLRPETSDVAWRLLLGYWVHHLGTPNSISKSTYRFTPERKMITTSSLSGGVMPFALKNERVTDVLEVGVSGDAILLTLGPTPLQRRGGVMTVRLLSEEQLMVEEGPVYTKSEEE